MIIHINLSNESYDIVLERGSLKKADSLINLDRRVLVVTDSGVPSEYSEIVANMCKNHVKIILPEGEASKSPEKLFLLLEEMLRAGFTRHDAVVAVGGGVVGDISGFAASIYMRGIDFYNIPTTLLSQVDSSVGGKTAIDFMNVKNVVGTFYQPKKVIIDPEVLKTLSSRLISCGLAEAIKMSLTSDAELFNIFENCDIYQNIDTIIERSLRIKAHVVECDAKESGLRKILNFGHTIGHGIESAVSPMLYHGECVALGMLAMCSEPIKERLIRVLKKAGLPTEYSFDKEKAMQALLHDKKSGIGGIDTVYVDKAGSFITQKMTAEEISQRIDNTF